MSRHEKLWPALVILFLMLERGCCWACSQDDQLGIFFDQLLGLLRHKTAVRLESIVVVLHGDGRGSDHSCQEHYLCQFLLASFTHLAFLPYKIVSNMTLLSNDVNEQSNTAVILLDFLRWVTRSDP